MVSTLLGCPARTAEAKPPFRVEDDAVQPTRGVGLIEVRPDISRRAVSWLLTTPGAGLAPGLRPHWTVETPLVV